MNYELSIKLTTSYAPHYTFSGKERDAESGLNYFGARYYNSDLSIWLSVDPMVDKYPNLSPYTYCAGNPVRLVDPDGREIGDFFDQYGRYLGHDGINDNNVYIISDYYSQTYIKDRHRNKQTTNVNDKNIKVKQITQYKYLKKAYDIYCKGVNNRGNTEIGGAYDENDEWIDGTGYSDHVELPITHGCASIHLHPWNIAESIEGQLATHDKPSKKDLSSFQGFHQNIIVGMSEGEYNQFAGFTGRKPWISFYDCTMSEPTYSIEMNAVKGIIKFGLRKGKL